MLGDPVDPTVFMVWSRPRAEMMTLTTVMTKMREIEVLLRISAFRWCDSLLMSSPVRTSSRIPTTTCGMERGCS